MKLLKLLFLFNLFFFSSFSSFADFVRGDVVKIVGLTQNTDLNGKVAKVHRLNVTKEGRHLIVIIENGKFKPCKVKQENLEEASQVEHAHYYLAETTINAKKIGLSKKEDIRAQLKALSEGNTGAMEEILSLIAQLSAQSPGFGEDFAGGFASFLSIPQAKREEIYRKLLENSRRQMQRPEMRQAMQTLAQQLARAIRVSPAQAPKNPDQT